jgi:hypothetical protein
LLFFLMSNRLGQGILRSAARAEKQWIAMPPSRIAMVQTAQLQWSATLTLLACCGSTPLP